MKTTKSINMKIIILLLIASIVTPAFAHAQSDSTKSAHEIQLEKQMEQLQQQLDEMQKQLDSQLKQISIQIEGMDSFDINMPESKEMKIQIDTTVVRIGKWDVGVNDNTDNLKINIDGADMENCCDSSDESDMELKNVETQFFLMDLGLTSFTEPGSGTFGSSNLDEYNFLELKPNSMEVGLHIFRQRVNIIQHKINLEYGLQLQFNNYKFTHSFSLATDTNLVVANATDVQLTKNKLTDTYLNLPIMLNFTSNPFNLKKSFALGVGAYGGYLIGSHTKAVSDENGKVKMKDDYNLNPLQYGVTGYIGYGGFKVFGRYSMTEMFKENSGPVLTPVSIGLVLLGWD